MSANKLQSDKIFNLYPIDYPFETLVNRVANKKLILNPEFQRKYKWNTIEGDEIRTSRFIESCLMRIPLPACYFAEKQDGTHEVIDGVQRITTIKRFLNNEFALQGLSFFKELEGKKINELGDFKTELENTTIRCIILRKENPPSLFREIFSRLNQGAVLLTKQEIRHAVYSGSLDNLLIELSESPIIKKFAPIAKNPKNEGREYEEIVLRFFAMNDLSEYEDNLSEQMDKYMEKNKDLPEAEIGKLRTIFHNALSAATLAFGDTPFTNFHKEAVYQKQTLSAYDLIMWGMKEEKLGFIEKMKSKINTQFKELCNSEGFKNTYKNAGTSKKAAILKRRSLWDNMIKSIKDNEQ